MFPHGPRSLHFSKQSSPDSSPHTLLHPRINTHLETSSLYLLYVVARCWQIIRKWWRTTSSIQDQLSMAITSSLRSLSQLPLLQLKGQATFIKAQMWHLRLGQVWEHTGPQGKWLWCVLADTSTLAWAWWLYVISKTETAKEGDGGSIASRTFSGHPPMVGNGQRGSKHQQHHLHLQSSRAGLNTIIPHMAVTWPPGVGDSARKLIPSTSRTAPWSEGQLWLGLALFALCALPGHEGSASSGPQSILCEACGPLWGSWAAVAWPALILVSVFWQ